MRLPNDIILTITATAALVMTLGVLVSTGPLDDAVASTLLTFAFAASVVTFTAAFWPAGSRSAQGLRDHVVDVTVWVLVILALGVAMWIVEALVDGAVGALIDLEPAGFIVLLAALLALSASLFPADRRRTWRDRDRDGLASIRRPLAWLTLLAATVVLIVFAWRYLLEPLFQAREAELGVLIVVVIATLIGLVAILFVSTTLRSAGAAQPARGAGPQDELDQAPAHVIRSEQGAQRIFISWVAGSVATVGLVPGLVGVATTALLILLVGFSPPPVDEAQGRILTVIFGPILGLAAWLIVGLGASRFAEANRANPTMYQELRSRADALGLDCEPGTTETEKKAACIEIAQHRDKVRQQLGVTDGLPATGPAWPTGGGYISLWQRVHRAEEAELIASERSVAVSAGLYDRARLHGSTIPNGATQLALSAKALVALDPKVADLLGEQPPSAGEVGLDEKTARQVLRTIRRTINEFRDDKALGLVGLRRRLTVSLSFTGLTANLFLLLAILAGIDDTIIVAAAGLYLVAAVTGLLQRMYSDLQMESAIDDFGLSTARLLLAPLVSGVAGIGGVLLVAIVSGEPFGFYLVSTEGTRTLEDAFTLTTYPFAIIVAAAFGLTPGILLTRLTTLGEQLKTDLAASETSGGD